MKAEDAIRVLHKTIKNKLRHEDYDRTVNLAILYNQLITGEETDSLLFQFIQRETLEMFNQRKRLTKLITPALASSIAKPFYKVSRNDKIIKKLEIKEEKRKKVVQDMIDGFYGSRLENNGLDYFMQTRFVELSFCDPNSFIVVEFDEFDPRTSFAQPRPFEISSAAAINYEIRNDELKWVIAMLDHSYLVDPETPESEPVYKDGHKYTIYTDENAIVMKQIDPDYQTKNTYEFLPGEEVIEINKEFFAMMIYEPNIGFVPAQRVGYVRDVYTKGRTCVNPFHDAMPYFMKSVKTVSEMDLTMTLHVFPQKIQYVSKCMGESNSQTGLIVKTCNRGMTSDGAVCGACKGSGFKIHSSAQDAILLPLPDDKQEMFDLTNIVNYVQLPMDVVKFMDEFINSLEEKSHRAVFNSDVFVKKKYAATATEKDMDMDSVYDTLLPFAKKFSSFWKGVARVCVALADITPDNETEIVYTFPSDFKLKTVSLLVAEIKNLNDSGAPSFAKDVVNNDLASMMYSEDKLNLLKYQTKQRFFPFNGKSTDEIGLLMSSEYVREFDKVLYANFESVFADIEKDIPQYWFKTFQEQWEILQKEVGKIQLGLTPADPKKITLPTGEED